jgi:hypothetical protein
MTADSKAILQYNQELENGTLNMQKAFLTVVEEAAVVLSGLLPEQGLEELLLK